MRFTVESEGIVDVVSEAVVVIVVDSRENTGDLVTRNWMCITWRWSPSDGCIREPMI